MGVSGECGVKQADIGCLHIGCLHLNEPVAEGGGRPCFLGIERVYCEMMGVYDAGKKPENRAGQIVGTYERRRTRIFELPRSGINLELGWRI